MVRPIRLGRFMVQRSVGGFMIGITSEPFLPLQALYNQTTCSIVLSSRLIISHREKRDQAMQH